MKDRLNQKLNEEATKQKELQLTMKLYEDEIQRLKEAEIKTDLPFRRLNNRPSNGSKHSQSTESFFISQKDYSKQRRSKRNKKSKSL